MDMDTFFKHKLDNPSPMIGDLLMPSPGGKLLQKSPGKILGKSPMGRTQLEASSPQRIEIGMLGRFPNFGPLDQMAHGKKSPSPELKNSLPPQVPVASRNKSTPQRQPPPEHQVQSMDTEQTFTEKKSNRGNKRSQTRSSKRKKEGTTPVVKPTVLPVRRSSRKAATALNELSKEVSKAVPLAAPVAPPVMIDEGPVWEGLKYIGPTKKNRPRYKSKQSWEWDIYPHGVSKLHGKLRIQIKQRGFNPAYPLFPNSWEGLLSAAMFRDKEIIKLWNAGILVRSPKFNFMHLKELKRKPNKRKTSSQNVAASVSAGAARARASQASARSRGGSRGRSTARQVPAPTPMARSRSTPLRAASLKAMGAVAAAAQRLAAEDLNDVSNLNKPFSIPSEPPKLLAQSPQSSSSVTTASDASPQQTRGGGAAAASFKGTKGEKRPAPGLVPPVSSINRYESGTLSAPDPDLLVPSGGLAGFYSGTQQDSKEVTRSSNPGSAPEFRRVTRRRVGSMSNSTGATSPCTHKLNCKRGASSGACLECKLHGPRNAGKSLYQMRFTHPEGFQALMETNTLSLVDRATSAPIAIVGGDPSLA